MELSCLVDQEKADGQERHGPEGKLTAMHRDDELSREESHRQRQQQRSEDQSLERGDARGQRQRALQRWECSLDDHGQTGQQCRARGGECTGSAAEVRDR